MDYKDSDTTEIKDRTGFKIARRTCGSAGKESTSNVGDLGLIPGSGRCPGERNGNPLQYSCLENSMDRGACPLATVHRVTTDRT